jgi:molybdopterin synthase sulfur carrier subunit
MDSIFWNRTWRGRLAQKEVEMPLIKFYANLRSAVGKKEVHILGANVQEVLDKLILEFPEMKKFLMEEGRLRSRVIITVNGQSLQPEISLKTTVSEQDQIAIFPPIAGG